MSGVPYLPFAFWGRTSPEIAIKRNDPHVVSGSIDEDYCEQCEKVSALVIQRNLTTGEPNVLIPTKPFQAIDYSWGLIAAKIEELYDHRVFWHTIKAVLVVSGTIFLLLYLSNPTYLQDRLSTLARRDLFWVREGHSISHRAFQLKDLMIELGSWILAAAALLTATTRFIRGSIKNIRSECTHSLNEAEKKCTVLVHQVFQKPSSLSKAGPQDLANNREQEAGTWIEPICYKEYTQNELLAPQRILVGKYALEIASIIWIIFKRSLLQRLENSEDRSIPPLLIHHPLHQGHLTVGEHKQFVDDFTTFFNISPKKFLSCWNIKALLFRGDQVDLFIFEGKYQEFARLINFINLLPESIVNEYAPQWIQPEYRPCLAYCSAQEQRWRGRWTFSGHPQRPLKPLYELLQIHWPAEGDVP